MLHLLSSPECCHLNLFCCFLQKDFVDYSIGKLIHEDDQQNFIDGKLRDPLLSNVGYGGSLRIK